MDNDFSDNDSHLIYESVLELDEGEADRAAYLPSTEEALRLLGRDNRIGIVARKPVRADSASLPAGRVAYDIGLILVLHAHPECKFEWSRLVVDLAPTPDAIIEDMAPAEVMGEPVELETRVGAELKFATILKAVDVQLAPEIARKRTVHFPSLTSSGTGFQKGYWDFQAGEGGYIPSNRELRLLCSAPADAPIAATFTVRVEARLKGWRDLIPLRSKHGGLDIVQTLIPARENPHQPASGR